MAETRYWLLKCNVRYDNFDKLLAAENRTMAWMGVRNAQARNLMRDKIEVGDGLLFYHSSTAAPAVMGTARVVSAAYPDHSAWDKDSHFYDPKTDPDNPKWLMVDIQADLEFARPVTLREIKANSHPALRDMMLVQPANRLSIQPVSKAAWDLIVALGMGSSSVPVKG